MRGKNMKACAVLGLLVVLLMSTAESYKILALMNVLSHSHHSWNIIYLKALADRGHDITYISVDEYKNPPANIRHILIENAYKVYENMNFSSVLTEMSGQSPYRTVLESNYWIVHTMMEQTKTKGFQTFVDLVRNEKFDGVVFDLAGGTYLLGCIDILGRPPIVGITAYGIPPWTLDMTSTPYPIANAPHFTYPLGKNLDFIDRVQNAAFFYFTWFHRKYFCMAEEDRVAKTVFGNDIRNPSEIMNDINVNMVNANWAIDNAFPHAPGLIPIGGLHIVKPKALPQDLEEYLDKSKHGVVYFSLGSNIQFSHLEDKTIEALKSAFRHIAPLRVIWKWENETMPGKPDNVKISKWLPQNDILAHPNVRLFITHGGALGGQEATYHGVPILGLPFFVDQHVNVLRAVCNGLGETIPVLELTAERVVNTIKKIVYDPKYKETATRLSKIFRDELNPPLDRAVFWTEYAIRHNGAAHLKPPSSKLCWFSKAYWDVLLLYFGIGFFVLYIVCKIASFVYFYVTRSSKKKKIQ